MKTVPGNKGFSYLNSISYLPIIFLDSIIFNIQDETNNVTNVRKIVFCVWQYTGSSDKATEL